MGNKKGFTLVEIMIVVGIIALIAAIAIPNYVKAREQTQKNACIENLRQIHTAVQIWSVASNKTGGDTPTTADLAPAYIRKWPVCPKSSTSYSPSAVSAEPACPTDPVNHHL